MYPKLHGRIVERFGACNCFADAIGLTSESVSRKMNGKTVWTQKQILKTCEVLEIPFDEIHLYFFTNEVQRVQLPEE